MRILKRSPAKAALLVALVVALAATTAPCESLTRAPAKAKEGNPRLRELAGDEGASFSTYEFPLAFRAAASEPGTIAFLVIGVRLEGDRPRPGSTLHGGRRTPEDWVVDDGSGAYWVTGLPAPPVGKRVLFSGRFLREGGPLALRGIRYVVSGDPAGTTFARPGDFIHYPLSGTKSSTCPVELEGDAAEIAFTDERDTLLLRAVKPGAVKVRVFSRWFTDEESKLRSEHELSVEQEEGP